MSRTCYVNGRYVPACQASVSLFDRGHHFADGLYEVIVFFNRTLLDEDRHFERLKHSLQALSIPMPMSEAALKLVIREMIARHPYRNGYIYLQITRGTAKRDHPFPTHTSPNLTMLVGAAKQPKPSEIENGVYVITVPDIRWGRCDIKSISLLPNVLARQESIAQGAREVFQVNTKGEVTEGSLSNTYIVKGGSIITHPADECILNGVRRQVTLELAKSLQIKVEERPFTVQEAYAADEAFLSSANSNVLPVTRIDDKLIGGGKPGPIAKQLFEAYQQHVTQQTGYQWN